MLWCALRLPDPSPPHETAQRGLAQGLAQGLATWALQFTPRVTRVDEAVLMELQASLRLFGGAVDLAERVQAEGSTLGAVAVAWAPTALGALGLARAASGGLARRHGVTVRPLDVLHSDWDCTLEAATPFPAVRLGLRLVKGLGRESGQRIAQLRLQGPPVDAQDLAQRAGLDTSTLRVLAAADALRSLARHRRQQVWDATAVERLPGLLDDAVPVDDWPELPAPPEGEDIVFDYAATGLTLRRHPLALLRPLLTRRRLQTAAELAQAPDGRLVRTCGIVTLRQQPETAKGTTFVSLEGVASENGKNRTVRRNRRKFRLDLYVNLPYYCIRRTKPCPSPPLPPVSKPESAPICIRCSSVPLNFKAAP